MPKPLQAPTNVAVVLAVKQQEGNLIPRIKQEPAPL